jgi:hypothetical protein
LGTVRVASRQTGRARRHDSRQSSRHREAASPTTSDRARTESVSRRCAGRSPNHGGRRGPRPALRGRHRERRRVAASSLFRSPPATVGINHRCRRPRAPRNILIQIYVVKRDKISFKLTCIYTAKCQHCYGVLASILSVA